MVRGIRYNFFLVGGKMEIRKNIRKIGIYLSGFDYLKLFLLRFIEVYRSNGWEVLYKVSFFY